jgi:TonB family protein
VLQFDGVLDLLELPGSDARFADLRVLALGFRDLARAANAEPTQSPNASAATLPARQPATPPAMLPATSPATLPARTTAPASGRVAVATTGLVPAEGVIVYDASAADVVPPVPLKPILPPVASDLTTPTAAAGLFEILIDEKGRVESAIVRRSVTPQYDSLVLREARNWRYQPATRHGQAVWFRKVIEIYTAPLESVRRDP